MALSQKHRSSLYRSLAPVVGDEEAEALLSQFPSNDLETPATKDFVHAEAIALRSDIADVRAELKHDIAQVRTDLTAEIAQVRTDLTAEIAQVRTDLTGDIAEVRTEIALLRTDMSDRLRQTTVWLSGALIGAVVGGMGVAVGIASLV